MINLYELPRTTAGKRMFARVSPIYDESLFMRSWYDGLGGDWEGLRAYFTTLREQHFTQTVDWGIEYLEHKFSIIPDRTLSLEERRARLKRRVAKKYPLNPAVLEEYAKVHHNVLAYLDEHDPGYIHVILNHGAEHLGEFLEYLAVEKPAHLALDGRLLMVDFIGTGGDWEFTQDVVNLDFDALIPRTDEEKKHVPRLYAGIVETNIGTQIFETPKPKNFKQTIHAGIALVETGLRGGVKLALPDILFGNEHRAHVGQALVRGGGITIEADMSDLPTYDDIIESGIADLLIADVGIARPGRIKIPVETLTENHRVNLFAGVGLGFNGERNIDLAHPPDQKLTFHLGMGNVKRGEEIISTETDRRFEQKLTMTVGQVVTRTGTIAIDSATKTSIPEGHRYKGISNTLRPRVGNVLGKFGYIEIGAGNRTFSSQSTVTIRAGCPLVRSGNIIINAEDDLFDLPEGDWLRQTVDKKHLSSKISLGGVFQCTGRRIEKNKSRKSISAWKPWCRKITYCERLIRQ